MDRFLYTLSEKPIVSTLFVMGMFVFAALALVNVAQHGQVSFMQRAEATFSSSSRDDAGQSSRNSSPAAAVSTYDDQETGSTDATRGSTHSEPLVIRRVAMVQPVYACGDSATTVRLSGMRIAANEAHKGGVYAWKMDVLSGLDLSAREQWRGSIPAGETDYRVSYEGTDTGSLYTRTFTHPHDEIKLRIRVVSPNDATSAWFIVPASDQCPAY